MERDKKKQHQAEKPEQLNQIQYLNICLNSLLTEVTRRIPIIIGELSSIDTCSWMHCSMALGKLADILHWGFILVLYDKIAIFAIILFKFVLGSTKIVYRWHNNGMA